MYRRHVSNIIGNKNVIVSGSSRKATTLYPVVAVDHKNEFRKKQH